VEPVLQTAIVVALVAVCAFFAIRRGLRSLSGKKTGCGCAECPALKDRPKASSPADPAAKPQPHVGP
jgi:hypothetical protein